MAGLRQGAISALLVLSIGIPVGWTEPLTSTGESRPRPKLVVGGHNLDPTIQKLGRGVSNALGGWLEIPLSIGEQYAGRDTGTSLVTGVLYGLIKGVVRTGVGVYEAVTFFLPYPNDFAPILPTLPYFQAKDKRKSLPFE